jgi:hypothetical protein
VNSIWNIELGLIDGTDQGADRADGIVAKLRGSGRHVEGEAPAWRATYVDFESDDSAREALRMELEAIDPRWSDVFRL